MLIDILEEHFDEASFLYEQWKQSGGQPRQAGAEGVDLEHRLEANILGLLLGGEAAWALCEPRLSSARGGDAFVAALVALADDRRRPALELALSSTREEAHRALRDAQGWKRGAPSVEHAPEGDRPR